MPWRSLSVERTGGQCSQQLRQLERRAHSAAFSVTNVCRGAQEVARSFADAEDDVDLVWAREDVVAALDERVNMSKDVELGKGLAEAVRPVQECPERHKLVVGQVSGDNV